MNSPMRLRRPLLRAIPLPVEPRAACNGGVAFAGHHVDGRVREVVEPTGVVEIEVRQPFYLTYGRQLLAEVGAHQSQEKPAQAASRVVDVAQPESRVDEHKPERGLEQQAVTRELPTPDETARAAIHESAAERAGRDAIQVKYTHAPHVHDPCRGMWLAAILRVTAKEGI